MRIRLAAVPIQPRWRPVRIGPEETCANCDEPQTSHSRDRWKLCTVARTTRRACPTYAHARAIARRHYGGGESTPWASYERDGTSRELLASLAAGAVTDRPDAIRLYLYVDRYGDRRRTPS